MFQKYLNKIIIVFIGIMPFVAEAMIDAYFMDTIDEYEQRAHALVSKSKLHFTYKNVMAENIVTDLFFNLRLKSFYQFKMHGEDYALSDEILEPILETKSFINVQNYDLGHDDFHLFLDSALHYHYLKEADFKKNFLPLCFKSLGDIVGKTYKKDTVTLEEKVLLFSFVKTLLN